MSQITFAQGDGTIHLSSEIRGSIGEVYDDLDLPDAHADSLRTANLFCSAPDLLDLVYRFRELCEVDPDATDPSSPMWLLLKESEIVVAMAEGHEVDSYGNISRKEMAP